MAAMLGIWGLLSFAVGVIVSTQAKSAGHEIEAGIAFLVATVSIGAGCVVEVVQDLRKDLKTPDAPGRRTLKQWLYDERPSEVTRKSS